jgi:hypothetical protein
MRTRTLARVLAKPFLYVPPLRRVLMIKVAVFQQIAILCLNCYLFYACIKWGTCDCTYKLEHWFIMQTHKQHSRRYFSVQRLVTVGEGSSTLKLPPRPFAHLRSASGTTPTSSPSAATLPSRLRPSMESGPVTCEICQKVYKNRSTLYSHKNRDHGIKVSMVAK